MRTLILYGFPILFFILGLPLFLEWVPPNRLYGFRTDASFSSQQAWYQLNRWTGLALMAAGVLALGANLIIEHFLTDHWKADTRLLVSVLLDSLIVTVGVLIVVARSGRF